MFRVIVSQDLTKPPSHLYQGEDGAKALAVFYEQASLDCVEKAELYEWTYSKVEQKVARHKPSMAWKIRRVYKRYR